MSTEGQDSESLSSGLGPFLPLLFVNSCSKPQMPPCTLWRGLCGRVQRPRLTLCEDPWLADSSVRLSPELRRTSLGQSLSPTLCWEPQRTRKEPLEPRDPAEDGRTSSTPVTRTTDTWNIRACKPGVLLRMFLSMVHMCDLCKVAELKDGCWFY